MSDAINLGGMSESLNFKVDLDINNLTALTRQQITTWSYIGNSYDNITLLPTGETYDAPADGFFWLGGTNNVGTATTPGTAYAFLTDIDASYNMGSITYYIEDSAIALLPVKKGHKVRADYGGLRNTALRFYYAEGSGTGTIITPGSGGGGVTPSQLSSVPVGTVIWNIVQPDGYLICNGNEVSSALYPELSAICGTKFGTATQTGFFKLPCLTDGRFVKGSTAGGVGLAQDASLLSHTHTVNITSGGMSKNSTGGFTIKRAGGNTKWGFCTEASQGSGYGEGTNDNYGSGTFRFDISHTHTVSGNTGSVGGSELKPKCLQLLPCIKT